jgi:thiol-disulfide isomerase/thioredoxin
MSLYPAFAHGLSYTDFLAKYGTPAHQARWHATHETVTLTPAQTATLQGFSRQLHVVCLAGAWCGDCASQCPIFARFAAVAPVVQLRFLDRDDHADVQAALKINGGNRVPVCVFFSEDGHEILRYGERTLSKYRQLMQEFAGAACPTGIGTDPLLVNVTQEWLNEFERAHAIARLSPRLRKLHND